VDCAEHVAMLEQYWEERTHKGEGQETTGDQKRQLKQRGDLEVIPKVKVCLDMACGFEVLGLHLGANRRFNLHSNHLLSAIQHS